MRRKLRSKGGFTLTELLTAVAILGLIAAALEVGLPTAVRAYRQVTASAEAQVLCSTLSTAIADELRYAAAPRENGGAAQFDSAAFGRNVSFGTDGSGKITIGGLPLVGDGAYTSGLGADAEVSYRQADGLFTVRLVITDAQGQIRARSELTVDPLNVE